MNADTPKIMNNVICCRRGILKVLVLDGPILDGRIRIEVDFRGVAALSAP
jgi:hypothetical protein